MPLIRSRISVFDRSESLNGFVTSAVAALGQPAFASSIMATPDMICPDVQKPNWKPSRSMNAAWSGWSAPSRSSPSIVVILLPSCMAASVMQDSTRRPSTCTVHAPHSPRSHPFFVPVSAKQRFPAWPTDWGCARG